MFIDGVYVFVSDGCWFEIYNFYMGELWVMVVCVMFVDVECVVEVVDCVFCLGLWVELICM